MARGGKRDGAGRKPGPSKRAAQLQEQVLILSAGKGKGKSEPIAGQVLPSEEMPLEFLLGVMRDPDRGTLIRIDAAKAAAPYCHAKLSQVEHKGDLNVTHEQALKELA